MATALKIPKQVFMDRLASRLKDDAENVKVHEKIAAEFDKVTKAWEDECLKFAIKSKVRPSVHVSWNNSFTITYADLPGLPARPTSPDFPRILSCWEIDSIKEALTILALSDGEYVPAAISKSVSRFLV